MTPEIRYAHTSDGVSIAYFAVGSGPLLIGLVQPPMANADLFWRIPEYWDQLRRAAQSMTYVQYDPRGFGMSDRAIDDFSLEAMVRDLEAVVEALGRERFAITTWGQCAIPALAYAAANPQRVIAMVLRGGFASGENAETDLTLDLARDNWEFFVRSLADRVDSMQSVSGLGQMHELMRRTASQETFIRYAEQCQRWDVLDVLPSVTMPVLVTHDRGPRVDASRRLAAALPHGSLVSNDVPRGMRSPSEDAFEAFLANAFAAEPIDSASRDRSTTPIDAGLTPRELAVLRLAVEGRSGKEIAAELVVSSRTVERHIANIYRKTATHGRAQLTAFALRQNLV